MTPKVTFIIPVKNEERFLEPCIKSLLSLDYPKDKVEIVFAEGKSTDNTRVIIERYTKKNKNIKILDNPTGNTSIGRNICVENATGDFIMNFSGHAVAPKDFLTIIMKKFNGQPVEVAGVGVSNISPDKQTFNAHVAGAAFLGFMAGSGFFMQNTVFKDERFVEHMSFTCYRKEIFDEVGNFDPEFWCGQDAEFDIRVRKKGYKILYIPDTSIFHYKRDNPRALFHQLYRYGIARMKIIKKHPRTWRIFHFFPSFFVLGVAFFIFLAILHIIPWVIIGLLILVYVGLCFLSTAQVTKNPLIIMTSLFYYLLIKLAYGIGFIRGILPARL